MSEPSPAKYRLAVMGCLIAVYAAVGIPASALAQEPQQGQGRALDLLDQLERNRSAVEAITASLSRLKLAEEYCLPPDEPNKGQEEKFLNAQETTLNDYSRRYNALRAQLLSLITRDGNAARVTADHFQGNPADDASWQPWRIAFKKAREAIQAKRTELKTIPEIRCRPLPEPPPPPPPPPPTGPVVDLPAVTVRPVEVPPVPDRFCSEAEKVATLQRIRAVEFDFYLNYQDAREYLDAITDALARGQGNASVLRALLPAARQNLNVHTKRLDDLHTELARVRAMPVVDCGDRPQTAPEPIPPLLLDLFVFPAVPDQFCSQAAKDETVRQLEAARNAARRNYDKAATRITELGDRIGKGDNSTATSAAFREATTAASGWLKQAQDLDAELRRAQGIPVVDCQPSSDRSTRVASGGSTQRFTLGFGASYTHFSNFESDVGDQPGITSYSASSSPVYYGALAEFGVTDRIGVQVSAHYGVHRFTQHFGEEEVTGRVRGLFLDGRLIYNLPVRRFNFSVGGGLTYVRNELDEFRAAVANLDLPGRTHNGMAANFGVSVDVALWNKLRLRVGADYTDSFKTRDADRHWRGNGYLTWGFGGR